MKIEFSKRQSQILLMNAGIIWSFILSVEPELRDIKRYLKESYENKDDRKFNVALDAIDDLCQKSKRARSALGWLMDDLQKIDSRLIDDDE